MNCNFGMGRKKWLRVFTLTLFECVVDVEEREVVAVDVCEPHLRFVRLLLHFVRSHETLRHCVDQSESFTNSSEGKGVTIRHHRQRSNENHQQKRRREEGQVPEGQAHTLDVNTSGLYQSTALYKPLKFNLLQSDYVTVD